MLLLLLFCLVRFFGVAPRFFGGAPSFFALLPRFLCFDFVSNHYHRYYDLFVSPLFLPILFHVSLVISFLVFFLLFFFFFGERERERERDSLGCFQDSWKSLRVRQGQFQEGTQPISSKKKSLSREGVGFSGMLEDP